MSEARFDVAIGTVPDYATFLRHVWGYRDEEGSPVVVPPPWVYAVLFEDADEVAIAFALIETIASTQAGCGKPMVSPDRISISVSGGEDSLEARVDVYEVRFADLQALHVFLLMLASQSGIDMTARQTGEFLMWTLGFRWV